MKLNEIYEMEKRADADASDHLWQGAKGYGAYRGLKFLGKNMMKIPGMVKRFGRGAVNQFNAIPGYLTDWWNGSSKKPDLMETMKNLNSLKTLAAPATIPLSLMKQVKEAPQEALKQKFGKDQIYQDAMNDEGYILNPAYREGSEVTKKFIPAGA